MPRSGFHCREAAFEAAAEAELTRWGVWWRCKPMVVQGRSPWKTLRFWSIGNHILAITNFIILNDKNIISIQGNIFGKIGIFRRKIQNLYSTRYAVSISRLQRTIIAT